MKDLEIYKVLNDFKKEIKLIRNLCDLNKINSLYIGKHGKLNNFFTHLKKNEVDNKIEFFKKINDVKSEMSKLFNEKKIEISYKENFLEFDLTLPKNLHIVGSTHIINDIIRDVKNFFNIFGFKFKNGIEIDNKYNNFDALNMPLNHPSRNLQDTFYIDDVFLLRTHTSNMQIHLMKKKIPSMRFLSCGKVYRRDYDLSHTPMFHQIEGFIIENNVSLANLKFILLEFLNFFFNNSIIAKFRSSYFPFTEPSFEVDIKCFHCSGIGCSVCKSSGWIEILGCGLIHPKILKECKIDPYIYNGFAFGIGVERLAMIKYKINDIKLFFENNIEFLNQF
ncbi:MAG TPA: phenylalanine--tRNA ligase subunit alpha [Candidatus Azoamicus sp.]